MPEVAEWALFSSVRREEPANMIARRRHPPLVTELPVYRMLRQQTARENNHACICRQPWRQEVVQGEWPPTVLAEMQNETPREEFRPSWYVARHEALLEFVFVRHLLRIGAELLLQWDQLADREAEQCVCPRRSSGVV